MLVNNYLGKIKTDISTYKSLDILKCELNEITRKMDDLELEIKRRIEDELHSTQLITYEIRESISRFIESQSSNFRVNFFQKKKTMEEISQRKSNLYNLLSIQMRSQLDVYLINLIQSYGIDNSVMKVKTIIDENVLMEVLNKGATISNSYNRQYAKELESMIKGKYKKYYFEYISSMIENLHKPYIERKNEIQEQIELSSENIKMNQEYERKSKNLNNILNYQEIKIDYNIEELLRKPYFLTKFELEKPIKQKLTSNFKNEVLSIDENIILSKSRIFEELIRQNPSLTHFAEQISQKIKSIENKNYSIVLFGAFSAGKSSLINSLLGQKILPSLPRPTTSVITYIKQSSSENKNLTTKIFRANHVEVLQLVDLEIYITEEELAKNIDKIEIYYDCYWTRNGITFIDTPGISSIHKRHTEISFSFMKDADIILYVSYFNHTISRSGREFLYQLGRVKDGMDEENILFLINAVDLAENEDEINMVKKYYIEQLNGIGITNPNIFTISSKLMLRDSINRNDFIQYLDKTLMTKLKYYSLISLEANLTKVYEYVDIIIEKLRNKQLDLEYEKVQLKIQLDKNVVEINELTTEIWNQELNVECEELFYHVKKRLMIKFRELFIECFHPSAIKVKNDVNKCLNDFLEIVVANISQELLATTLRIEKFISKLMQKEKNRVYPSETDRNQLFFYTPKITEINIPVKTFVELIHFKNSKTFFEGNGRNIMLGDYLNTYKKLINVHITDTMKEIEENYQKQMIEQWDIAKRSMITEFKKNYTSSIKLLTLEEFLPLQHIHVNMSKILKS